MGDSEGERRCQEERQDDACNPGPAHSCVLSTLHWRSIPYLFHCAKSAQGTQKQGLYTLSSGLYQDRPRRGSNETAHTVLLGRPDPVVPFFVSPEYKGRSAPTLVKGWGVPG